MLAQKRSTLKDHIRCGDCTIRQRAVCSYCGTSELAQLDAIKSYRTYAPGEEICGAGEPIAHVGSVVNGVVGLTRPMADGRRQMVGLLLPSDFIGRPGRETAVFDVTAVTEVRLCTFERRRFEKLLQEMPQLERRLLHMMLDELDAAREWMLLLGRKSATEKIASFIVMVANRRAALTHETPGDGFVVDLPLSREQIAEFLGLTIETVSRQIGRLKSDGLIELVSQRTLRIPRFALLLEASGDDSEGGVIA